MNNLLIGSNLSLAPDSHHVIVIGNDMNIPRLNNKLCRAAGGYYSTKDITDDDFEYLKKLLVTDSLGDCK